MGPQCNGLRVLLRVASLERRRGKLDRESADHEATWLLGHTERITFLGDLRQDGEDLYQEAMLGVPCRYLKGGRQAGGAATEDEAHPEFCAAHGYSRRVRKGALEPDPAEPRSFPGDRFRIVEKGQAVTRVLPPPVRPPRELPIHAGSNPCIGAPCRTADNARGAACCRDLQVEIMCTPKQRRLEALVRSRQSPYLCKVEREGPFSLGAEMISACAFLMEDKVHCALHGRKRPDGRPAKPDLCSEWPERGDTIHPGCVFASRIGE